MVDMLLKNIDRSIGDRVIALPVSDGLKLVHVNEIVVCESDSNYTTLHMRDDKRLVISRTLKEFEDLLGNRTSSGCIIHSSSAKSTSVSTSRARVAR